MPGFTAVDEVMCSLYLLVTCHSGFSFYSLCRDKDSDSVNISYPASASAHSSTGNAQKEQRPPHTTASTDSPSTVITMPTKSSLCDDVTRSSAGEGRGDEVPDVVVKVHSGRPSSPTSSRNVSFRCDEPSESSGSGV